MKATLVYFLKLIIFWLCFFGVYRTIFLILYQDLSHDIPYAEVLGSYFQGIKLEFSMLASFLLLPLLLVSAMFWLPGERSQRILRGTLNGYILCLIVVSALLQSGELATYEDWHTKINVKVFFYLTNPMEGVRSATGGHMLVFFGTLLFQCIVGIGVYWKWIRPKVALCNTHTWKVKLFALGSAVLGCAFLLFVTRGSLRPMPVDLSTAFYSRHFFLNDVAVNTPWNFIHSIKESIRATEENIYATVAEKEAEKTLNEIYACATSPSPSMLKMPRPNLILIIQEGVSADMIGAYRGEQGFSPCFDSLANGGIIFPNVYSCGWTSDVGHLAILAGFPALPLVSAINEPDKYRQLPSLIKSLSAAGYAIDYYYGGQSTYGNIKGFVYDHGASKVTDEENLPSDPEMGRIGYHDAYMYHHIAQALPEKKGPHCAIFFTLSTHSPYDIPNPTRLQYNGQNADYAQAVYFADSALGQFIREIKANGSYDNSLIVTIPDHSHASVCDHHILSPERYRIGMMMGGGAIKDSLRGKQITKIASQLDCVTTILTQLDIDATEFHWGRNLLDPDFPEFAAYVYAGGMGWITPEGNVVWDYDHQAFYLEDFAHPEDKERLSRDGKAFLQVAYRRYLDLSK